MEDLKECLYGNNLKNREFGKEDPRNLHSERVTIAERQGTSENAHSEENPTQLKTDFSSCFGIYGNNLNNREFGKTVRKSSCFLFVEGLVLDLFVGCLPEERIHPQPIEIDLHLFFSEPPLGCISDNLSDTVCYARCVEIVKETTKERHFQLLESLCLEIHTSLTEDLPKHVSVQVRVKKLHPPISNVTKGISFTYG